jgi:hypothetical protein|tara:strand:- start:15 stop:1118 length:1104 start_codon:yes stop_codon:yes gene_type:complete
MTKKNNFGIYYLSERRSKYIFGYTHDFDKTEDIINKIENIHYQMKSLHYIRCIQFYDLDLMKQFVDILEQDLEIILYTDKFYELNKKEKFEIPEDYTDIPEAEIKDLLSSKLITLKSKLNTSEKYKKINEKNIYSLNEDSFIPSRYEDKYLAFKKIRSYQRSVESELNFGREIKGFCYIYIVGPENARKGIHNLKVGKAEDLNDRMRKYQSHNPEKIALYFSQSCYGSNAVDIEEYVHEIIKSDHKMIHQDWCRMTLDDLLNLVRKAMQDFKQPEYEVIKFDDSDHETFISYGGIVFYIYSKYGSMKNEDIEKNFYVLSMLEDIYESYKSSENRKKESKKLKEFEKIDDCYKYLYQKVLNQLVDKKI